METAAVLAFAAFALAMIAVPGPDWAYVLAAGARDRVVLSPVAGLMAGYGVITTALVVGIGPLVEAVPPVLVALTALGAGYLIYLGLRALCSRPSISAESIPAEQVPCSPIAPARGHVVRGIAVSGLNPKGVLIFLAILPQFANRDFAWPMPLQLMTLGIVFILLTPLIYVPLGLAARRLMGARPGAALITTRIAGAAMLLLGLGLVVEKGIELVG